MIRTTLAALAIVSAFALIAPAGFVGAAQAWTVAEDCGGGGGGGDEGGGDEGGGEGGGDFAAAADCPTSPSSEAGGGDKAGDGGDLPALTDEQHISTMEQTCNAALANLTKIPASMVTGFAADNGVSIVGVCNSGLGHKVSIDASQALPLQAAIAANPVLSAALRARGYSADDVVGVVIIDGAATLYTHKSA